MKNLVISVCAFILTALNMYGQDMTYVYRNNGIINPIATAEIDSIRFSKMDVDSILCDSYVSQEIFTADSIYRFPIAQIDSVAFTAPQNQLKIGVTNIDSIRSFVIGQNDSNLYLNTNIPRQLVPKIGDKLVTTEMSEIFPSGFVGEVSSLSELTDSIVVKCIPVALDDVFEYYYSFTNTSLIKVSSRSLSDGDITDGEAGEVIIAPGYLGNTFDLFGLSVEYEPVEDMAISISDIGIHLGIDPVIKARAYVLVNPHYGTNIGLTIIGNYELTERVGLAGNIEISKDFPIPFARPKIPVCPFVYFYTELGLSINASGSIASQNTWNQGFKSVFHWEYSSRNESGLPSTNQMDLIYSKYDGQASLDGEIKVGGYIEAGFEIADKHIANANLRGEIGAFLSGNAVLYKTDLSKGIADTSVYERLRESGLDFGWYTSVDASAKLFQWGISHNVDIGGHLNRENILGSYRLAPYISDTGITRNLSSPSDLDVYCKLNKGLCTWSNVGFSLRDASLREIDSHYLWNDYSYIGKSDKNISHTFNQPIFSENYAVYPLVNILGFDLLATPSSELENQIKISTLELSNVGVHFANLRGKIENPDIISNKDECVVCFFYNTTGDPCQENGNYVVANVLSNLSNGFYSEGIRNLEANTTYYYVAAMYVGAQLFYGDVKTFKTKKSPDPTPVPDPNPDLDPDENLCVLTGKNYNIECKSAIIECSYFNIPADAECGYFLDEESNSNSIKTQMVSLGTYEGTKNIPLDNLTAGTTYYYQAYAKYNGKSYLGSEASFTTLTPSASTGSSSDVSYNSASVEVSFGNVCEGASCGIELTWNNGSMTYTVGSTNGSTNYKITNLSPATEYTYCAYVELDGKTYYGEDRSFVTEEKPLPDLTGVWTFKQTYLSENTVYVDLELVASYGTSASYRNKNRFFGVMTLDLTVNSNGDMSIIVSSPNGFSGSFSGEFNDDFTSAAGSSYFYGTNSSANPGWMEDDPWSFTR